MKRITRQQYDAALKRLGQSQTYGDGSGSYARTIQFSMDTDEQTVIRFALQQRKEKVTCRMK